MRASLWRVWGLGAAFALLVGAGCPKQRVAQDTVTAPAGEDTEAAADTGADVGEPEPGDGDVTGAPADGAALRGPDDFAGIANARARALALFEEAGQVLLHPRCTNCHPDGNQPYQGDSLGTHIPPVERGPDGHGAVGMRCQTCHMAANVELGDRSVPGDPAWGLAPLEMAWQGKTLAHICEQLKDPERNGKRELAAIVAHVTDDSLVGWAWRPGTGRTPAPGDQATFGALLAAWVEAGAHCPAAAP